MINSIKRIMYCQTAVVTALVGKLALHTPTKILQFNKLKIRSTKSVTEDSPSPNLLVWRTNTKLTSDKKV